METKHPNKQQGHDWMVERTKERKPLPDIQTIRREMGMDLIDAERKMQEHADLRTWPNGSGRSLPSF